MKKLLNVLGNPIVKRSALAIIGLTTISIVGANYLAEARAKEIERELETFTERVPVKTDYNETAIALKTLSAKLGFDLLSWSEDANSKFASEIEKIEIETSHREAWRAIEEPMREYLDAQITQPNNAIDPPPTELQEYLKTHAKTIEQIKILILNSELPVWQTTLSPVLEGDNEFPLPSYLGSVNLQQILALDILEKQRQGQTDAAREILEVSWKLHESFQENPYLIGQLVFLINGRYITGTMRKLGDLPMVWQERLVAHNSSESMLTSIQGEFFWGFNTLRDFPPADVLQLFNDNGIYRAPRIDTLPVKVERLAGMLLSPVIKPWLKWSAIDTYHVANTRLEEYQVQPPNVCTSDVIESEQQAAAWNIPGKIALPSFLNQPVKAQKYTLDLELTQKILQAKALAAETGKWPATLPNLESNVCPGSEWVYNVAEDGTMSLSLNPEPEWAADRLEPQELPIDFFSSIR